MSILTVKRTCTHERLKQDVISLFNCKETDYDIFLKAYFNLIDAKILKNSEKFVSYTYIYKNYNYFILN